MGKKSVQCVSDVTIHDRKKNYIFKGNTLKIIENYNYIAYLNIAIIDEF